MSQQRLTGKQKKRSGVCNYKKKKAVNFKTIQMLRRTTDDCTRLKINPATASSQATNIFSPEETIAADVQNVLIATPVDEDVFVVR
ncbi:hypothetical protein L596_008101 [Steinernema carpocapsae]|uniref:Uncharacterized protein n=1 Tax=Steinernema carpocapsae TaxID=34508 RepID=A0A4U5PBY1_STECR|nr:hypothetical protein L596_008101 [Steinernema carpocapsae]